MGIKGVSVCHFISHMSKTTESRSVDVDCQWVVRCDKSVKSHIKFLISHQERIMDISLYNIRLWLARSLRPVGNIRNFVEEKNAFALTFSDLCLYISYGLHNPHSFVSSFELL